MATHAFDEGYNAAYAFVGLYQQKTAAFNPKGMLAGLKKFFKGAPKSPYAGHRPPTPRAAKSGMIPPGPQPVVPPAPPPMAYAAPTAAPQRPIESFFKEAPKAQSPIDVFEAKYVNTRNNVTSNKGKSTRTTKKNTSKSAPAPVPIVADPRGYFDRARDWVGKTPMRKNVGLLGAGAVGGATLHGMLSGGNSTPADSMYQVGGYPGELGPYSQYYA